MERRSSSPDSLHSGYRYKNKRGKDEREYGRNRRSRSRDRSRDYGRSRRSRSRSRSRDRRRGGSPERDLYKDLINDDHHDDREKNYYRNERRSRDRDRDRRDRDNKNYKRGYSPNNYNDDDMDSHESDSGDHYTNQIPYNKIIVRGLAQHITEADISSDLMQYGLKPLSIRLIRKKKTGASRGFAFVEFSTEEEATRWMEYKQGILMLQDQYRAVMQYSISKEPMSVSKEKFATDWYCAKCGVFNFKRRENCFKCYASREESEKGGEGSDEVSNILTKKIMLRNLDVLTNEEGVLTVMQEVVPTLVSKISKILICRDPLTSTSRGICYLSFDNLVDSMNTHNALKGLEPPLSIENREVLISYCVDSENRNLNKNPTMKGGHPMAIEATSSYSANSYQYTAADVPRLAEYSASIYASNSTEHEHYLKYYTQYYMSQISKGQFNNLPTMNQLGETANSGAAVAQSAIQRKQIAQNKYKTSEVLPAAAMPATANQVEIPKGNDGKKYPIPDVSLYQYDETSGYYYDPQTGLYFDPHSQYYYNNETNSYLYWDNENSTYTLATNHTANTTAITQETVQHSAESQLKQTDDLKKDPNKKEKHDKVKVAKKIVKDMEKWAKQLNQKKDMNILQAPIPTKSESDFSKLSNSGYADVGFSILEKKDKGIVKFSMNSSDHSTSGVAANNKLVAAYGSDSENDLEDSHQNDNIQQSGNSGGNGNEKDYIDFEKLTCLLCKRAFQSLEILNKHLRMSNLHKENMQKYNLTRGIIDIGANSAQGYRDRAKERRLKYGEGDPPPPNRSKERFQREMEKQAAAIQSTSNAATVPIGENNVGNKLLQKMGWTEGQGLGRSNQGRTNIIEAESRVSTAGLGSKASTFGPGDDYKSYIKRMMKTRYEQVDIKD